MAWFLAFVLMWLPIGQAQVPEAPTSSVASLRAELCKTPRDAAASLVDNLQSNNWEEEAAAACLDVAEVHQGDRVRIAVQLKQVMDSRGLAVPTGELTTDPNYQDDAGEHRIILFDELPQVYLVKKDGVWLYSRSTINMVPSLYKQTFSPMLLQFQEQLPQFFFNRLFNLFLWQYLYFFILIATAFLVGRVGQLLLMQQILRLATKVGLAADNKLMKRVQGPLTWLAMGLVFSLGVADLQLGVQASFYLHFLANCVLSLSVVVIATRVVDLITDLFQKHADKTESKLDDQVIPLVNRASKTGLWALGFVFILQNIGVEVTALLAGVSVGGVAVALAAQDTISNLFGSLTIFTDRPFQIGDWVVIDGNIEGIVEEVGFRSTRIRTFNKSVVSVPNAKVANSTVDNVGKRTMRKLKLNLGLRYDTSPANMRKFLAETRAFLAETPGVSTDTLEVRFINFGDSALELMVYTFLDVPDWTTELTTKENILIRIMEIAAEIGVDFAFPSISVYTEPSA